MAADKKTQDERIAELLKFSPDDNELSERLAKLKGTSSKESGNEIIKSLKAVANQPTKDIKSMTDKAQRLGDLAGKLAHQALQNNNTTEKVQWLNEANKAKALVQNLHEQIATKTLYARSDKLKDFPAAETARDTVRELKEAKSAVRNAHSPQALGDSLEKLKTAMQKVLNKAAQSEKSAEKNQLIQEVRDAKTLFDLKNKQLNSVKQPRNEDSSAKPKGNFSIFEKIKGKLQAAGAMGAKVISAVEKYYGNKTDSNRAQAVQAIRGYRQQAQLQQKTTQIKSSVNNLRNNINELEKQQKHSTMPSNNRSRRP